MLSAELVSAMLGAEVIGPAGMLDTRGSVRRVDVHPADRVHLSSRRLELRRGVADEAVGVSVEPVCTVVGAEVIGPSGVLGGRRGVRDLDLHGADGVFGVAGTTAEPLTVAV